MFMYKSLIETKNNLLEMLNNCDRDDLFSNMQTVITTVRLTSGLWFECTYDYKVVELMQIILDKCNRMQTYSKLHYKTVQQIEDIKKQAYSVQEFFHKNKSL